jgi:hypothetical protein
MVFYTVKYYRLLLANGFLISLMLLGQVSLLAHEALHKVDDNYGVCVVCLNSPVFKGAYPPPVPVTDSDTVSEPVILTQFIRSPSSATFNTSYPRAPPSVS